MSKLTKGAMLFAVLAAFAGLAAEASAGTTRWCGGNGGDKTLRLSCPSGQMITSLSGKGAAFLDDVGFACGARNSDGKFAPSGVRQSGPKKLQPEGSGVCRDGRVVAEIITRSGLFVDRIVSGWCSRCPNDRCDEPGVGFSVNAGGGNDSAGQQCVLSCPAGEGAFAIEVRYGAWIDAIRMHCRKP